MEVQNLNEITMMVPGESNIELLTVLMYGCVYGEQDDDYEYTISPTDQIRFEAGNDVQEVLDETIPGRYYLRMECSGDRVVTAGEDPPEDAQVIGSTFDVPLPDGGTTTAYLYRWREA